MYGLGAKKKEPPPPPAGGPYFVLITDEARKAYDKLPGNIKKAMGDKMEQLKAYPEVSGVRFMFGKAYGKQRLKFWDWRLEFTVDERTKTITVTKIGHRDTMYEEYYP